MRVGRFLVLALLPACGAAPPEHVTPSQGMPLQPVAVVAIDTAPKEDLRMVPPEVYMRTYLQL